MTDKPRTFPVAIGLGVILGLVILIVGNTRLARETGEESPFGEMEQLPEAKIPILMYHYVEYNQNEDDYLRDQQNVPPHVFEQQIIDMREAGYTFLTPKQLPEILKTPSDEKYVILSFDDGFRDFYTDAYPIIKKHNVPVVAYIVYNFFGGQDYMTEEMVREIADDGLIEIGSHTLNHAYLPGVEETYAEAEIAQSKSLLEEKFGVKVESFAYPYGNFDEKTIQLTKKAGYKTAVTVEFGNVVKPTELFTLKRIRPGHLTGAALLNYISL